MKGKQQAQFNDFLVSFVKRLQELGSPEQQTLAIAMVAGGTVLCAFVDDTPDKASVDLVGGMVMATVQQCYHPQPTRRTQLQA